MSSTAVISFLQLWLATLAFAAPAVKTEGLEPWHYGTGGGIVGFVVLVMDIIVWSR